MVELVPGAGGIGPSQSQLLRQLLQCGGGVLRPDVGGDLPGQHRAAAEVLAHKAELLQHGEIFQGGLIAVAVQIHRQRRQQRLGHQGLGAGLQRVKADPLVGGVFIDEPHVAVAVLADDIGLQHLARDAPGRLARRLHGLLNDLRLHDLLNDLRLFFPHGSGRRRGDVPGDLPAAADGGGGEGAIGLLHHVPGVDRLPHRGARRAGLFGIGCRRRGRKGRTGFGPGGFLPKLRRRHGLIEGGLLLLRLGFILSVEGVQNGVVHRVEDRLVGGEFHHRLGRMDVHVHLCGGYGDVEHAAGELALHDLVAVGLLQRRGQELGLDKPPVDKEDLAAPCAVAVEGLGDEALHRYGVAAAAYGQQVQCEVTAQSGVDGALQPSVAGGVEHLGAVPQQLEGDLRVAQSQMGDDAGDGGALGAVLLHELHPGGGVVKEIPHHDGGALRAAGGAHLAGHAALQMESRAGFGACRAGEDVHPAHGADGGQCLAPEAQGADGSQILRRAQLAGGVAQEGHGKLVRRDAAAVVGDAQIGQAAPLDLRHDGGGAGVHGVFQQLLGHAGRSFHHLAGGDQIGHVLVQLSDLGHGIPSFGERVYNLLFSSYSRFSASSGLKVSTWQRRMASATSLSAMAAKDT